MNELETIHSINNCHLEYKVTHLSHFEGTFSKAMKIIICQDKEPLFPPKNDKLEFVSHMNEYRHQCCYLKLLSMHPIKD